jgi:small-conductance mechanosensitive channel
VVVNALSVFIDYIAEYQMKKNGSAPMIGLLRQMTMGVFWLIGGLLILSNLGVNITSLIAGLGIGGVAVALALQNVLGDLFSSFAIYFDKPFEVGDFIQVGQDSGTVKKVGIKTTRLQSLQGEEIIISNQELTTSRINNFRRIKSRNVIFSVGVLYETPQEKLEKIPDIFKSIIENIEQATFNRAHLRSFDDSAITFEFSYFVNDDDFVLYLDKQQEVLLALNKVFTQEKIEFAYPTQTLFVKK